MTATLSVIKESTHTLRPFNSKVDKYSDDSLQARAGAFLDERMPWPFVRCGGNLKGGGAPWSARKERERALACTHISFNTATHWNAITIDCDHGDGLHYLQRLQEQGQPVPTWTLLHRRTGRLQPTWWYSKGKSKASPQLRRLHDGIYEHMRASLDGDRQFKQYLARNPLYDGDYEVLQFSGAVYDFKDFIGPAIEWSGDEFILAPRIRAQHEGRMPGIPAVPRSLEEVAGPKGSRVWEIGYRRVHRRRSADYGTILAIYEEVAAKLGSPIKPKQLEGMARRSARWMAAHPEMLGKPAVEERDIDEGVMKREAEQRNDLAGWQALDKTSKRVLAAERTNAVRASKAVAAIAAAAVQLWAGRKVITQAAIAAAADVSVREVKRNWNDSVILQKGDSRSNPFSPPGQGSGSPTLRALATASRERARAAKEAAGREAAERATVMAEARRRAGEARRQAEKYSALAAAMRCRRAVPQPVPPCALNSPPAVKAARADAMAARKDCQPRATARQDRAAARVLSEERRDLFRAWAEAGNVSSFEAWMVCEKERWGWVVDSEEGPAKRRAFMRRAVTFKRYRVEWDTALTLARHRDDAAYWRAVRRREQPIVIVPALGSAEVPPMSEGEVVDSQPSPAWPEGIPSPALGFAKVPSFIRERAAHRTVDTAIRH